MRRFCPLKGRPNEIFYMSNNLKNTAIEDFDWEAYENGETLTSASKEEQVAEYDKTLSSINANEVVKGTVTAINKREVIVNVGYKSEGVIPASEFRYNPDLKEGDEVEVYIDSPENRAGQLVLSHKKARATTSWARVNEALENQEIVTGFVKSHQGWYDCRCLRHRGIPPRFAD